MKECASCINREYKDQLICCAVNHVGEAFRDLLKCAPFFGQAVQDYYCKTYEPDPNMIDRPLSLEK